MQETVSFLAKWRVEIEENFNHLHRYVEHAESLSLICTLDARVINNRQTQDTETLLLR